MGHFPKRDQTAITVQGLFPKAFVAGHIAFRWNRTCEQVATGLRKKVKRLDAKGHYYIKRSVWTARVFCTAAGSSIVPQKAKDGQALNRPHQQALQVAPSM